MSHIEEGKTQLAFRDLAVLLQQGNKQAVAHHPCMKLLHQALVLTARQYEGEIRPYYYTFVMHEQPTNTGLALHIPVRPGKPKGEALPRGIGLVIDEQTGALTFRGDPWAVDAQFYRQVQQTIVQKYTVLAHIAALRQMNYTVSTQQIEDRIAITGGRSSAA